MLFLVKYHRPASYSDEVIYIGLIEAETSKEAKTSASRQFVSSIGLDIDDYEEDDWDRWGDHTPKEEAAFQARQKKWFEKEKERL